MIADAESEAANPELMLACFVAIGFIVATSLGLASVAGFSIHSRKGREYIYQGAAADRLRRFLRMYPLCIWFAFFLFACAILASLFTKLDPFIMVGVAVACVTIVVSCMSVMCWNTLCVVADDQDAGRDPPQLP